jgi:hypothetical protein
VAAYAFSDHERRALAAAQGQRVEPRWLEAALEAAAAAGWAPAMRQIGEQAKEAEARLNADWALTRAAAEGHVEAMREARELGAAPVDWALALAAAEGHVAAMREARAMGAKNIDEALANAAYRGHLEAMRLAREWGARDYPRALRTTPDKEARALLAAWEAASQAAWQAEWQAA